MNNIKTLSKVVFGMENCEAIEVDGTYIGNLRVSNMSKTIYKHHKCVSHMNICDTFSIMINREANVDYLQFALEEWEENLFKRLSSRDISSVDLVYDDNTKDEFYVKWVGESDYENDGQDTYINDFGDMFIVISEDENVETIFNKKTANNKGYIDLIWKFNK